MISEEELKDIMAREGISCFNITLPRDSYLESVLSLEKNNIEELIGFMKVNNLKSAFYAYSILDKDHFIIDEELMDELDDLSEDLYSLISRDIEEHNKQIEKLDFSRPIVVRIFCIYESHYIGIDDYDLWIDETNIMSAEEKLHDLIDKYRDIIDKSKQEIKLNNEALKEEFKDYVLNDDKFKICTNQRLRSNYMYNVVFQREEAKKYMPAFSTKHGDRLDYSTCVFFIEMVWKEYKSQLGKSDK